VKRAKKAPEDLPQPFHNPFAGLESLRGVLPRGSTPAESGTVPISPPRAVVRLERKGRGGKEVTVVEQLQLEAKELARWLKELKQSLGCGGTVEGGALVFQGDQRQRLKAALLTRGVRRISGV
jgi:translation initiation factor 1